MNRHDFKFEEFIVAVSVSLLPLHGFNFVVGALEWPPADAFGQP
jgi:hypothetical protein